MNRLTMEEQLGPTDNSKKRRTDSVDSEYNNGPILFLNVGGANRNVRRSLLNDLRVASESNPLCDIILENDHWANHCQTIKIEKIKDASDGIERLYLDRDPATFDDLLKYIQCGRDFLRDILRQDGKGSRLNLLKQECDYFTVKAFPTDTELVMYGEPVTVRTDDWVAIKGEGKTNRQGEFAGWCWDSLTGNQALASLHEKLGYPPAVADVKRDGTYLLFFSLHSVAVTALLPTEGYSDKGTDEHCTLNIFHDTMTSSESDNWTFPLIRCGAFDYRTDREERENHPLLVTASCSDLITLREGSMLYPQHGYGIVKPHNFIRTEDIVNNHSEYLDVSETVNYITLVRLTGSNILKWNVSIEDDKNEPKIITWTPCKTDVPKEEENASPIACLDEDNSTIRFKRAGKYIIIGRVAAKLTRRYHTSFSDDVLNERPRIHLNVYTKGGTPLQNLPEVVSFLSNAGETPYNNKMAEYGHINDVIYAEEDSYFTVRGSAGACFAKHGSIPAVFDKIPAQSLTVMRLEPSTYVDRYVISMESERIVFRRAVGGRETPDPMCATEYSPGELEVQKDCQCIIFCSISSLIGSNATLRQNADPIVHSQICKDSGRGSHSLNCVLDLEEEDILDIYYKHSSICWYGNGVIGNLTLVQLTH